MCGLAGIFTPRDIAPDFLLNCKKSLSHRGPDASGSWLSDDDGIALIHTRLSILDVSANGLQPMKSPNGRWLLSFNGEIYNHLILRKEIKDVFGFCNWRGSSDTETLLVAIELWGIEKTLPLINGMFSFALWDSWSKKLYLARDRLGEKPIYYGRVGDHFLFASELKGLVVHPEWCGEVNRDSLALFMRYNHVPAPDSIYEGVSKLPPAHYIIIGDHGRSVSQPICYWSLSDIADLGMRQSAQYTQSHISLVDELDNLLKESVSLRMLSDVPVGAFLSGGYDSTMIVAQMQALSSRPVRTFSIGSEDVEFDEAKHAAAVAKHLGTDHSDLYVTADDALSVIPRLPLIFDEPFADSSQIPTFLVSQLARRDVTVALSGDGGDELFGGYNRHVFGARVWHIASRMPLWARRFLSRQILRVVRGESGYHNKYFARKLQYPGLYLRLSKLAAALESDDGLAFYDQLRAHWKESDLVLGSSMSLSNTQVQNVELLSQMIFQDMRTYLPDDILTKVDRASMAVGLEARLPYLDHRLVEFSWRVPSQFKVRDGRGKWLLRQALYRYVPRSLMERPKQGFGIPVAQWLRGPLRDWAESLLDEARMQQEGYLNAKLVRTVWKNHLGGQGSREHDLWCVLMFQAWLESQKRSFI